MIFIYHLRDLHLHEGISLIYFYRLPNILHKINLKKISLLEEKYNKLRTFGINMEFFEKINQKFDFNSLPYFMIYNNGELYKSLLDIKDLEEILNEIKN